MDSDNTGAQLTADSVAGIIAIIEVSMIVSGGAVWYAQARYGTEAMATSTVQVLATTTEKTPEEAGIPAKPDTSVPDATLMSTRVLAGQKGVIDTVSVSAGARVSKGDPLATVKDLALSAQIDAAKKTLADAQAKLADMQEAQSSAGSTKAALAAAQNVTRTAVRNAYIAANDTIANKAARYFTNPTQMSAQLNFPVADGQTSISLGSQMATIENSILRWGDTVNNSSFDSVSDTIGAAKDADSRLEPIDGFLVNLSGAIGASLSYSDYDISSDRSALSDYRTDLNNALSAVIDAKLKEQAIRDSMSGQAASASAIKAQQDVVNKAKAQLDALNAKNATTVIRAPASGTVKIVAVKAADTVQNDSLIATIVSPDH